MRVKEEKIMVITNDKEIGEEESVSICKSVILFFETFIHRREKNVLVPSHSVSQSATQ